MTQLRYDTDAINRDIPIKMIIERYAGINTDKRGNISCPSPDHSDNNPSAHVYERSNTCHCFSCQGTFSPVSLGVAYNPDLSFPDVCRKLLDDFGLSVELYSNIDEVRRERENFAKSRYTDVFPLNSDELAYIGLHGANGAMLRFDESGGGRNEVLVPSLHQMWKEDKDGIESMLTGKCNDKIEELNDEISSLKKHQEIWNSLSDNEHKEFQKLLEAVHKYYDKISSGEIVLDKRQKAGIELLIEQQYIPDRISGLESQIEYTEKIKGKITQQQEKRAEQAKSHYKRKTGYERD